MFQDYTYLYESLAFIFGFVYVDLIMLWSQEFVNRMSKPIFVGVFFVVVFLIHVYLLRITKRNSSFPLWEIQAQEKLLQQDILHCG